MQRTSDLQILRPSNFRSNVSDSCCELFWGRWGVSGLAVSVSSEHPKRHPKAVSFLNPGGGTWNAERQEKYKALKEEVQTLKARRGSRRVSSSGLGPLGLTTRVRIAGLLPTVLFPAGISEAELLKERAQKLQLAPYGEGCFKLLWNARQRSTIL